MTVRPVCIEAGDAVQLGELLDFLGRWLIRNDESLASSLSRFVGGAGYDITELRADLFRFAILLDGTEGELLFGGDER